MEIRSSSTLTMDSSDSSSLQQSQQKKSSEEDPEGRLPRPISPCDSEISVGCENDSGDRPLASPMDLTEEATEDEEHRPAPRSPSTSLSRGGPGSPQTLSPVSVHDDESESFTYLSEDEYFRPLKRLAMSDTSPPQHPTGPPGHVSSDSMSSPEPSTLPPNRQREDSKPQQSQQKQPPPLKLKLQQTGEVDRVNPLHHPMEGEEEGTTEGEEEVAERENDSEMRERRVAERELQQAEQKLSGLRSFSILDILSYKPSRRKSSIPVKIVRPWDTRGDESTPGTTPTRPSHPHESQNNNNNNNPTGKREGGQNSGRGSALDALFKMTNKTLDNLNKEDKAVASPSWVTLPGTEVPDGTAHWFLGTRKPPGHVKAATFGVCGGLQGVVLGEGYTLKT